MKAFFASLDLCEGNALVIGGFPSQRPVKRGLDVFLDLRLKNKQTKKKQTNKQTNNRDAGDLRRHRAYCDDSVMWYFSAGTYPPTLKRPPIPPHTLPPPDYNETSFYIILVCSMLISRREVVCPCSISLPACLS